MRRLFALFLSGGCLFAAVLFAMGAARADKCADAVWQNPVLYLEKPISAEDAQNIAENAVFTAWGETADQTVTNPDLGKSVQTNVVWLYGSSEWILPASAVLPADDGKGCLIGKNTAWKLFGSTSVTGLQICVDHQTRTIRGVVKQPENGVYLQGTEQKKKVFCRLTLASDKMEEAQNFLLQYGLTGHVLRMDYLRSWKTLSELVPGRWSDFSGWKENVQTRKQQLRQIAKMRKTGIEYYYETQCRRYKTDRWGEFVCLVGSIFAGYQYTHRKK